MDHPRPPVLLTYKRKDKGIKGNAEQGILIIVLKISKLLLEGASMSFTSNSEVVACDDVTKGVA